MNNNNNKRNRNNFDDSYEEDMDHMKKLKTSIYKDDNSDSDSEVMMILNELNNVDDNVIDSLSKSLSNLKISYLGCNDNRMIIEKKSECICQVINQKSKNCEGVVSNPFTKLKIEPNLVSKDKCFKNLDKKMESKCPLINKVKNNCILAKHETVNKSSIKVEPVNGFTSLRQKTIKNNQQTVIKSKRFVKTRSDNSLYEVHDFDIEIDISALINEKFPSSTIDANGSSKKFGPLSGRYSFLENYKNIKGYI